LRLLGNGRASKATSVPTATVGTHSFYKNERFLSGRNGV